MTIKFQAKHASGFTATSPLQPFVFPDGALHIKGVESGVGQYDYQIADLRGLSHDELFLLSMWADSCDHREEKKVLLLPYLPGARADRGTPFGAQLYADYLNWLWIDQIITLDPHSPVMPEMLFNANGNTWKQSNVTVFPVERIIKREVQDGSSDSKPQPYVGVIAPDKGARDRAQKAADVMGVPLYQAEKVRDFETGKLKDFTCDDLPLEGRFLIVDDICDGGGTFNGLADLIGVGMNRLDLWVTHGIFSKGLDELSKRFGVIHTTDSYFDPSAAPVPSFLRVHSVTPYLYGEIDV
jgi:ribose-phosphate pyrophosphokinase